MNDIHTRIRKAAKILTSLQYESGLFAASRKDVHTGYSAAWIRDNIYEAIGLEAIDKSRSVAALHALLDAMKKHEYKIDWAIKEKPDARFKYIHARINPETFEEFSEEWGNMQNDSIGALLFKIGDFEKKGVKVIRDGDDLRLIQKLVHYLASVEYWHDFDNGVWEENEEIHASSVGACVAGLKAVVGIVNVPSWVIENGIDTLNTLLPWESSTKEVDLALLSLIYPFKVTTPEQTEKILRNVEEKLVRKRGVIRYLDDQYYNEDGEAEWCMGFPWLAKIYKDLGNLERFNHYIELTHSIMTPEGEIPELYYANSDKPNPNTPLGWGHAMYLAAIVGE